MRLMGIRSELLDPERRASNLRLARFMAQAGYYSGYVLRDGQHFSPACRVEELAAQKPGARALWFEGRWRSFRELNAEANRLVRVFRSHGAQPGDCLALVMDSRPEYLITLIAANKLGMVVSLLNTFVRGDQLRHALRICSPRFILCGGEHVAALAEISGALTIATPAQADESSVSVEQIFVWREHDGQSADAPGGSVELAPLLEELEGDPRAAENPITTRAFDIKQPFCYIYTSGTTGLPKAVPMTNSRFLKAAFVFGKLLADLGEHDVVYSGGLPFYHGSGTISSWGASLAVGGACGMRRRFSASRFFEDCVACDATAFVYVGEYCRYLLASKPSDYDRAHGIRLVMGAGLRMDIWDEFVGRFAIPRVHEFYGSTEANTGLFNLDGKPGMLGRRLPGQAIVAVDHETGEILKDAEGRCRQVGVGEQGMLLGRIRGLNQFDGYLDSSKNASKVLKDPLGDGDSYFNSGDLVMLHDGGWLSFRDRMGDTYRWKAENVSTNDVQEVLTGCPGVSEANVYGVEVPGNDGRAGMAALVVDDDFDWDVFASFVQDTLPAYSRPVFVRLEDELELTGSFKYVKTRLKAQGFDPEACGRPVRFWNVQRYVALEGTTLEALKGGSRPL